ncbi:YdcF family protein [Streptomyces kaniharaensis]|uniref:YdcF family protein n=1 Tax=Streptomyces kaniharaensis TaxID=212423 RepID=A0A6N7KYY7_9ACTN|nr:YdcF family protein [Streptomyces kaniharaensis]MQS15478.1 YdcF family protein [Streptomyces kaniharaensis]
MRVLLIVAVLLGGYALLWLLGFLGRALHHRGRPVPAGADYLVVLGGGLDGCEPAPPLAARLDAALERLAAEEAAGHGPLLLVTGGKGSHEDCTEASAMARYLTARGVPAERIRCEERAGNTAENLRFSAALMAAERPGYRCTVVTNGFHVVRSALAARRAGVPGRVLGADGLLAHGPYALLREAVGTALAYPAANAAAVLLLTGAGVLLGLSR